MEFLIAVQFLTKIPITIPRVVDNRKLARSMAYFSLVGVFLGACAAGLHYLVSREFTGSTANLAAIAFLIFVTGNLHGDGLMDTADGVFSGRPRERILEIMKDSRVGSHGVTAGALILLTKFVLLGELPHEAQGLALILAPALGRWSQVYGAARYPYARTGGGTASFTAEVGWRELFFNSFTVLVLAVLLLGYPGLIVPAVIFLGTVLLNRCLLRAIGGITGDTLGAVNECMEVLVLMVLIGFFHQ